MVRQAHHRQAQSSASSDWSIKWLERAIEIYERSNKWNKMKFQLTIFILITCLVGIQAQKEAKPELSEITSAQQNGQTQIHMKQFRYAATAKTDTVTVKVINPRGEMQTLSANDQEIKAGSYFDFSLNTKHWRPGTYHIIAEGRQGVISRRFAIPRSSEN